MTLDSTLDCNTIQLHFGSPRVFLASSLLFEVVDFGTRLGAQAQEAVALINELNGGDFSQGYIVTELAPVEVLPKQLVLKLNLDAPIVFIPSRVDIKEGPTIVVDLGRVTIFHDSGRVDLPPPDFLDYDINMRDLNAYITEGSSSDPVCYEDRAVIKKFDMHFNVSARNSQNLELPETKLSGKLPEMNIFVTKEKLRDILIVAGSIKPDAFVTEISPDGSPVIPHKGTLATSQQNVPKVQRQWLLDSFFEVGALNVMMRDTNQATSDRGIALIRLSLNGLRAKFDLSNQDMTLDAKLDRLRVKDRTPMNKTSVAKNLVASPKGKPSLF